MKKDNGTNFWISYADLMAGLLFVFILLIGAIIVKYSLLQGESKLLEATLKKEKIALENNKKALLKNEEALKEKEERIKNVVSDLEKAKKTLQQNSIDFQEIKVKLKESFIENERLNLLLKDEQDKNSSTLDELIKKEKKLEELALLEKEYKNKIEKSFEEKRVLLSDIEKLKILGNEKDKKLDELLDEILEKRVLIQSFEEKSRILNDEIKFMTKKLEDSKEKHELLSKDLETTKQKIKSFTGIKVKVISLLKNKLGQNIQIDPKNGSLRLSSKILFDEGDFELKQSSKTALKNAVYDYFKTILENEEINKHIDKISIEGHTNSKGTFLYNLELSQKRAYSVMDFLLSLDFKNKENLKNLIVASGRSFLDPIYNTKGEEDSDASRRIEIKFSLKNEEAIKEIANILE